MSDPRSRRGADPGDDYEPPASAREVAGVHAPVRATQTAEPGPSVVVSEPGAQQYQEKWTDATIVTKRRPAQGRPSMASLSGQAPKRTNWVSVGIWVAVGVAAFGLGGLLTHLKSSGSGSGTVVQASGPGEVQAANPTAAPTPQPTAEELAASEDAAAPEAIAEPEAETLDPSELKQAPKKALPRATAKPAAAPPQATAPKVSAPAKAGIPSEI
ncbi:MAG: hypothetical protein AB7K71_11260 [Polyangiaceae bacterium]